MLSLSCQYAIRAAVLLMKGAADGQRLSILEIAEQIAANEHTAGKILQQMVRAGLICSAKGPHGGFYIPVGTEPLPLIRIVAVFDGTDVFFRCGLGLHECSERKPCPIHFQYKAVREALYHQFADVTVQQLAQDLSLGKAFLKQ